MVRPTLKDIYGKSNDYHEIKASNLQNDYINPNDNLAIKNCAFNLRKKYLCDFIITFLFNLFLVFLLVDFIKSTQNIFSDEFFLIAITCISFFIVLCYIGNMLFSTINLSHKKAQYGIIKTKFFLKKKSQNNKIIKHYYAHVIFPSSNTFIKKVKCNKEVYHSISEGSNVLVVSFDNKSAHIVLI